MQKHLSAWKRGLAGVGALAVALAAFGLGTSAAHAEAPNPGNINPTATGSIEINKLVNPGGELLPGTGLTDPTVPADAVRLNGVDFSLAKLNVDLTTTEGWDTLSTVKAGTAEQVPGLDPAFAQQTLTTQTVGGVAGLGTFSALPVGAYLVQETDHSRAQDANGNPVAISAGVAPFIVTIPRAIDNQWTYDVVTYPKNSVLEVDKTLTDQDVAVGGNASWGVSAVAPVLTPNQELRTFAIRDTFDTRLEFDPATGADVVTYDGLPLVKGTDYVVEYDATTRTAEVRLTAAGLTKVKQNPAKQLHVTFVTRVIASGDGTITNVAQVVTQVADFDDPVDPTAPVEPGDPADPTSPPLCPDCAPEVPVDTPQAAAYYGAINIVKQDRTSTAALQGAEFTLHLTEADAMSGANPISVLTESGEQSVFVTGADGIVRIDAVKVEGSAAATTYYLHEQKAPAGYVTPANHSVPVDVVVGTDTTVNVVTVANDKQVMPQLPLTGGTGALLFTAAGMLVLLGAVLIVARNRRKAAAAA